ncbi:MAG: N-formylglutamate amidohydrolase [Azoarcus sp.]|jgi:predicted N-formylglutamate amidohydrolase|nr:N-formylglutamate amidohydrolase [Azoarcus sp.]
MLASTHARTTGAKDEALGDALVITCEHGGNRIPPAYRVLFRCEQDLLASHRGFDAGALVMARSLARAFSAPLAYGTVSRLLVDLNRSIGHRHLHFDTVRKAPLAVREHILERYYQPYRKEVERLIMQTLKRQGRVIHISSHSFTPELRGRRREADIGLLYDPSRAGEVALCERWKAALETSAPELIVRRNYPYSGKADGVAAWFRARLPSDTYVGVELEINQKHVDAANPQWLALRRAVIESLHNALSGEGRGTAIQGA